ncbi:MAG: hypothetical protein WBN96_10675 [Gammaproteobacteria bacterium]
MVPPAKISQADAASADFVFEGRFEGKKVLWHCHLATLASIAAKTRQASQRQFIEIGSLTHSTAGDTPARTITVGLNLPAIDAAAIQKTSIMVRNYKRLQTGRHEFGESVQFVLE